MSTRLPPRGWTAHTNLLHSILSKYNIPVVVNLTTVGENLQDQVNTKLVYSSPISYSGAGTYLGHPTVSDIFGSNTTNVANDVKNNLPAYAAKVSQASNGVMSESTLLSLFEMQYDIIFNNPTPIAEVLVTPKGTSFYSEYWGLMPFSRGNVHIASTDPTQQPTINPNYMMLEFDMQQQVGSARFVRRLYQTAPMSGSTSGEATPGYNTVPADATDAQWASWIDSACKHSLSILDDPWLIHISSLQLPPYWHHRNDAAGYGRCC